jgi:hypothetical protein
VLTRTTQVLCAARGWVLAPGTPCFHAAFCHRRARLCCECGVPTPYVFPLISPTLRLCARCEPGSPRYALLTRAQALDGTGLCADDLATLPSREVQGVRARAVEKRLRVLGQATLYLKCVR